MHQKGFFNAIILIAIVIVVISIAGYFVLLSSPSQTPTITVKGRKIVDIVLKVDAPFSTVTLTIQENGSVFYLAKQRGQEEIQDSGTFTPTQMSVLAKLIEEINFLDMKDHPKGVNDPEDGSTYTITVRILPPGPPEFAFPETHSVSCYQFGCEHRFLELKDKIIELWGKDILEIGV